MCTDCGCLETNHSHHDHHDHDHDTASTREISIKQHILQKNNRIAQHNREHLVKRDIFCMNWISAPGSGKTALLERMIGDLKGKYSIAVIEGDQQTDNDAQRIRAAGAQAIQINTGAACHLDADMIHRAFHDLELEEVKLLVIENVGNMVCPTAYDLGEHLKLAVISIPEGEDKPIKYPDLLLTAEVLLINKVDLLPHLVFDLEKCIALAKKVNPKITVFPVSATTGEGIASFYDWLSEKL